MIFKINNAVKNESELERLVNNKIFITYANSYSLSVASNLSCNFKYVCDGWPVALYISIVQKKIYKRLNFHSVKDFWISVLRTKRTALIGYSKNDIEILQQRNHINKFVYVMDGYKKEKELLAFIENIASDVDVIFLGLSQPKQENVIMKLKHLENKVSIVCCGAFWLQIFVNTNEINNLSNSLYLTPLFRFYNKPLELIHRTFFSIKYVFRNLR